MIRSLAGTRRLKVVPEVADRKLDPEPLDTLPCASGGPGAHLYQHSKTLLAFTGSSSRIREKLLGIPYVYLHQNGDEEFTVVFPPEAFDLVAGIVRPRRKRPGASAAVMIEVRKGLVQNA